MVNKLKHYRVKAEMTQASLAEAIGVSQPHYQRWESGQAEIPPAKLKKIATVLDTNQDALLGRHPPIEAAIYDDRVSESQNYYGEVAFHFVGGGEPLLLAISEESYHEVFTDLQRSGPFISVVSLSNQTVIVRKAAIVDAYFSSEAYDTNGPEHGSYVKSSGLHMPDSRDWEIIEAIADGLDADDFDTESVTRIENILHTTTDEEFEKLKLEGQISEADVEAEKKRQQFSNATEVIYRHSSGKKRIITMFEDRELFEMLSLLLMREDDDGDDPLIVFPAEGHHRTVFINTDAIDYFSVPTHRYENGRIESNDALL